MFPVPPRARDSERASERERERERARERESERERGRQRETEKKSERERERVRKFLDLDGCLEDEEDEEGGVSGMIAHPNSET